MDKSGVTTEQMFLTMVSLIADKYKMEIDIDANNHTVNITGNKENEVMCALEIADVFDKYAV